ncbi:MAG TPA: fibronectin type III domain-containing protein [Chthoniobacteraceae bacterium]|nr:fibronectin type III domain-containing protein [Chthoniobacteraceae bacterium]
MTVQIVPKDEESFVALCAKCASAVIAHAVSLDIKQNDPAAVTTDYYDYVGQPGTDPLTAGKRGQLNQRRQAVKVAQAIRRNAIQAGRDFNARAVDHLKGYLGRSWNTRWIGAGFSEGTLRLPRNPVSLLLELRAYLAVNTPHELPANGVTAAQANTLALAISAAELAEGDATDARNVATIARDESFERLRDRIVGLRNELEQLIDSDDMRWRTFGFARPIDRRIPKAVTGLTLRAGGLPGEIIVEWPAASGAENYRVLHQVQTVDPEPVEVGLFTDRAVIIGGLPSGQTVIVSVTARNPAGETLPTNATIVVA